MSYTASDIDALLPEILDRNPEKIFPLTAFFITMFQDKTADKPTNHRGRYTPYISAPPGSFGYTSPAGTADLVTPSAMTDGRIQVLAVHMESGLEIDYDAWINNQYGQSIIDIVTENITLQLGFFNQMRDVYASSGNGTSALGTASATSANGATSITCNGSTDYIGTTRIFPGMYLDAYDATLVTKRNTSEIHVTAVSGTVITVDAMALSSSIVNTDILVPTGLLVGFAGEPYHVAASGAYFDKSNRALIPGLVSSIISSAGTLSPALMLKLQVYVSRRGTSPDLKNHAWFLGTSLWPVYRNIAYTNSRFVWDSGGRPTTDLGQKGRSTMTMKDLSFDGTPMYVFKFWTPDRLSLLDLNDFEHHTLKPLGLLDLGSAEWLPGFNGDTSKYRHAKLRWIDSFEQTFCRAPLNQGALTGLTITGSETITPKGVGM